MHQATLPWLWANLVYIVRQIDVSESTFTYTLPLKRTNFSHICTNNLHNSYTADNYFQGKITYVDVMIMI
jgi:hypothetical protein